MEQRQRLAYPVGRLLDERFGELSGEQLDGQVNERPDGRTQDLLVGADALPTLPEGEDELWRPYRSLVNVRPPRPVDDEHLAIETPTCRKSCGARAP